MAFFDFLGGPPIDRFAKAIIDQARRRDPSIGLRYDKGEATIFRTDGEGFTYLGRTFGEYAKSDREEQARIIDDTAATLTGQNEVSGDIDFETAKPRLRPTIKNLTHVLNEPASWKDPANASAIRPLSGPLGIVPVVDFPRSMRIVIASHLQEWGVNLDQVIDIAIENLRAESPCKFVREDGGFYVSDYGDFFDASRILLPHLFEQLSLKGDPVVIAIVRNGLVVAGSDDPSALAAMAAFAEAAVDNEPRAIAYAPIVVRHGQWTPWVHDPITHPEFERLRIKQRLFDSSVQKDSLSERLKAENIELPVADLLVHEHDRRPYLFAQVKQASWVPRIDVICTAGPEGEGMIPRHWEDVEAVAGPFAELPNAYPPLYRIEDLDDDQLRRLRADFTCPAGFEGFEAEGGIVNLTALRR